MGRLRTILGILLAIGSSVALLWLYAPSIASDLAIKGKPTIEADAVIVEASCKVRLGFISSCKTEYLDEIGASTLRYMIFADIAGTLVEPLADAANPGRITTNVGLEYLHNRIATLAAFVGLCLLGAFVATRRLLRGG